MLLLTIGTRYKIEAPTVEELAHIYTLLRDDSNEGASTWPDGQITVLGSSARGLRVSYNGRVWNGKEEVKI